MNMNINMNMKLHIAPGFRALRTLRYCLYTVHESCAATCRSACLHSATVRGAAPWFVRVPACVYESQEKKTQRLAASA